MKVRSYERTCGEVLSEDDDPRRHLLVHAARLSTYPLVREENRSIIMARGTLTAPTDVSAVCKGKGKGKGREGEGKGKSKGKGKEKQAISW